MTLEVPGRRTGRLVSFPVVVAEHEGGRYLVSILGDDANWVRNVRAADGRVVLRRRGREQMCPEAVEPGDRAPILRRYLAVAPGARPHLPVDRHAPLAVFERDCRSVSRLPDHPRRPGRRGRRSPGHAPGVWGALVAVVEQVSGHELSVAAAGLRRDRVPP